MGRKELWHNLVQVIMIHRGMVMMVMAMTMMMSMVVSMMHPMTSTTT